MGKIILDGALMSVIASAILLGIMRVNPRLFLQDYPKDIQAAVPPKTAEEKKLSLILGIPFLLVLFLGPFLSTLSLSRQTGSFPALLGNAFGVAMMFNLVDLLVLDWLLFSIITPKFVVIPGSEGMAGYKDFQFAFRGFLTGTLFSAVSGLVIAGLVSLIS